MDASARPSRSKQYVGALGATIGAFSLGTVIGWSSPAEALATTKYNITESQWSWISSIMSLGAATAQIYMALTLDVIGRKLNMLIICVPFIAGWVILAFSKNFALYSVGRFITGFAGGAFCVVSPTYIGEIADKGIRGTLGVLFQLLLVIGILLTYSFGEFKNLDVLTFPFLAGPIAVFIIMIFLPETPVFLHKKGKIEKCQKALKYFRGKDYDISAEMKEIEEYNKPSEEKFWQKFKTKVCYKPFLMLLVMHSVQQLSGINAIMFFADKIFKMASSSISSGLCTIILGIVQVVFTCVSAYLVDRAGRRMLWIISLSIMGACMIVMGVYFNIKRFDEKKAKSIAMLPLIFICVYLAGFSLGTGPLPWVMLGEFLPISVKGLIGSFIACFNWLLAFAITRSFDPLVTAIGADIVFYIYAGVCFLGVAFVIIVLIETRNKTLEEIQIELGG